MSRVNTLTDIQTLVLRERLTEEASTQTSLSEFPNTSNLKGSLRELARLRLENGETNLPLRPNLEGNKITDAQDFRNLNDNLNEETRLDILNSIANDEYRSDLLRVILSSFSSDTLISLNNTLREPINTLETYTPFLNIIMYGNIGLNDFNIATANLLNLIIDLQTPVEPPVLNVEQTVANIEERNSTENRTVESVAEESNSRRNSALPQWTWRTIFIRSGTLFAAGTAMYFGSPHLGSLVGFGARILQNLEDSPGTAITSCESRTTWNDVSNSFWRSWGLLARYMGSKD